jgi:hypothetical protein
VGETRNFISADLGVAPLSPWNLEAAYFDAGRLSRDGVVGELPRR